MSKTNDNKFVIKNNILANAVFGPNFCENSIVGSGYIDTNSFEARALLTYLIQKMFQIIRIPGFEEEYLNDIHGILKDKLLNITEEELKYAIDELEKLYDFTQNKLLSESNEDGDIFLIRALPQFQEEYIINQLSDGKDIIRVRTNIISSYTTSDSIYKARSIFVKHYISSKDILMHHKYLFFPKDCRHISNLEEEVWVINKNIHGVMDIPFKDFHFDPRILERRPQQWQNYEKYRRYHDNYANPKKVNKPCESPFIQKCIKLEKIVNIVKSTKV
jgi:hypothetical protein